MFVKIENSENFVKIYENLTNLKNMKKDGQVFLDQLFYGINPKEKLSLKGSIFLK